MADKLDDVRAIFNAAGVPMDRDDTWAVQGTPVVKHKALERLAAALKIKFQAPIVLRHERDEAVLIVTGTMGDNSEWSTGEALVVLMVDTGRKNDRQKPIYEAPPGAAGNYQLTPKQAGYPYAMAEKRGKDRVILKLANLAGVYSEDEADAFKQPSVDYAPPADRASEEPRASAAQLDELAAQIQRTGRSALRLLNHYGVKEPKDLSSSQASDALALLKTVADAVPESVA
jgi:hypothetical protein